MELKVSFNPFPSLAQTECGPIVDAWKEAESTIRKKSYFFRQNELILDVDFSDVLNALSACEKNETGDGDDLQSVLIKWVKHDQMPEIKIFIENEKSLSLSHLDLSSFAISFLQELYIALNFSAIGAGHLNGAKLGSFSPPGFSGYYGDSIEISLDHAKSWEWPVTRLVGFEAAWNWLEISGFRRSWLASSASEKALIVLLDIASRSYISELEETLLLARAIESLMAGEGAPRSVLKRRIEAVLGAPQKNKSWLNDFYDLRNKVAHGHIPLVRRWVATEDDEAVHAKKFWVSLDRARAVVLALVNDLIAKSSIEYSFNETIACVGREN